MEFHFSVRDTLKQSWQEYRAHLWLFLLLIGVQFLLGFITPTYQNGGIHFEGILALVVSIVWAYVALRCTLAIVDGETVSLSQKTLQRMLPTFRQFFIVLGISILTGIIYIAGLILLIIPGVYFIGRLLFSSISFVDEDKGVIESLKHSWGITKGDVVWTSLLVCIVMIALVVIGMFLFGVGLFITLPLALLLLTHLYRTLSPRTVGMTIPSQETPQS